MPDHIPEATSETILVIDNYDSFTYNLVHFLADLGQVTHVVRNDKISVGDALRANYKAVLMSPGPCAPDQAGICLELIKKAPLYLPIFGVCLGHQALGQAFGGLIVRAKEVMHGKTSPIHHNDTGLFKGLPNPMTATRYHSLAIERSSLSPEFEITAFTDDGEIMGISHIDRPLYGVQFHPESIATQGGMDLLQNFLDLISENKKKPS
jgi:anthranilate synthase component II